MTRYEQGFITKCAEHGVPTDVAGQMLNRVGTMRKSAQTQQWLPGTEPITGRVPLDVEGEALQRLYADRTSRNPWMGIMSSTLPRRFGYSQADEPQMFLPSSKIHNTTLGLPTKLLKDKYIFDRDKLQFTPAGTNLLNNTIANYLGGIPLDWEAIDFMTGRRTDPHVPAHQVDSSGKLTLTEAQKDAFKNNPRAYRIWLRDSGVGDAIRQRVSAK
jgi:hypothetical protein